MNVDDFIKREFNRRQFLGQSAQNAAGVAAGIVGWAGSVSNASPLDRVSVGVIGVRHHGAQLAAHLASFCDVDVPVVCDIDESQFPAICRTLENVQGHAPRCEHDFRRLLDDQTINAVVIAVPDHWHGYMAVAACHAGKDVYLETPLAHTYEEGEAIVTAADETGRIIQVGHQERSSSHFQSAIAFVKSGQLGAVRWAKAWVVHRRKSIENRAETAVPAGVDYDMWLGPAGPQPFFPNRFHFNWRWFWDFGGGELAQWGSHLLDVACWGLDVQLPTRVSASGGKYYFADDQQTPDTLSVQFSFPGKSIQWEHRLWSAHGIEGRSTGVAFYGERGTLVVDRGGWKVYDQPGAVGSSTGDAIANHLRNFIDAVKTRQRPTCDAVTAHSASTLSQLGNISYRLGRELQFEPNQPLMGVENDVTRLLSQPSRSPWSLPSV
ncbi:MAG: Gfo/Idh/MocA family oxidoreductase [Planctomycetota bacterium]|nr:Gfo/Idh/MocA family oxidoreductase [Planctomycetota bacterium]